MAFVRIEFLKNGPGMIAVETLGKRRSRVRIPPGSHSAKDVENKSSLKVYFLSLRVQIAGPYFEGQFFNARGKIIVTELERVRERERVRKKERERQ